MIFGSIPERILDWTVANKPDAMEGAFESVMRGLMPGIIPTAALPPAAKVSSVCGGAADRATDMFRRPDATAR